MIIMGIDSSTDRLAVGLAEGQTILAEKTLDSSREHASRIIGVINDILNEASVTKDRIEGIAVAIGPGSFTGLRIGLAVAKGMAYSLKIPLVGISTFEVMARRLLNDYSEFFLSAVVRRGEYYLSRIKAAENIRENIALISEADLLAKIGTVPAGLIGREPSGIWNDIPALIPVDKLSVSGGELAVLGAEQIILGRFDDIAGLEPLYIAPSQAERKFGQP
ncbi:MAG: tRNA (adenosine(37)-N6)-threonylcarbamoyltransferase complex dimerization subunit type 1 TsaB [FCB group bacterium]|nr:tRNA (adenosine(37)-N6)-threonylcarbamoyltransferase complex dimerization subunit type 1 TsaB [FCB group bacterium]